MGNSNGKPISFSDEGTYVEESSWVSRGRKGLQPEDIDKGRRRIGSHLLTLPCSCSESQPFSTFESRWKGRVWQGAHCREEGHGLDVCPQVHSQR